MLYDVKNADDRESAIRIHRPAMELPQISFNERSHTAQTDTEMKKKSNYSEPPLEQHEGGAYSAG